MTGKRSKETRLIMSMVMLPEDANPAGNVHGGVIMKHIDTAAGVVAVRHSSGNAVTASIDRIEFHHPVFVGNLLILKAGLNMVGKTSMEIGVRVETENVLTGELRHTASAYLTFVALDQDGKPRQVPELIVQTQDEIRRNQEAKARRATRLAERTREKECQKDINSCEF
jgi:uncharacterized protein (TIGR00369 family)